ncbi:hypothetical protein R1flu_021368 [Riccia fluitans]|uniref:Uncharacterized protein n=1 Tax=Riccia fluitans TaxID=41844 RepID=A0ABD1ZQQ6_9MARC
MPCQRTMRRKQKLLPGGESDNEDDGSRSRRMPGKGRRRMPGPKLRVDCGVYFGRVGSGTGLMRRSWYTMRVSRAAESLPERSEVRGVEYVLTSRGRTSPVLHFLGTCSTVESQDFADGWPRWCTDKRSR